MDEIELILIALLVAVAVLASAARATHLPYPVVLVLGGIVLGVIRRSSTRAPSSPT